MFLKSISVQLALAFFLCIFSVLTKEKNTCCCKSLVSVLVEIKLDLIRVIARICNFDLILGLHVVVFSIIIIVIGAV